MTNIYLEESPNPNSLKFVVNYLLVSEGEIYDYPDLESAATSPLAQALFKFDPANAGCQIGSLRAVQPAIRSPDQ